jgi:hypothetical protein
MGNVDTHRATHESFNRRDHEATVREFRPDMLFTDHGQNVTTKGPLEFIDWDKSWVAAFSDGQVSEPRYIDGGEYTVCVFRGRGTNDGPLGPYPATGRRVEVPFCEILRYDEQGKIVSGEIFYDLNTMLSQLGHVEPPPRT